VKLLVTLVPSSDGSVSVVDAVVDAAVTVGTVPFLWVVAVPSFSVVVAVTFVSMLVLVPFLLLAVDCPVVTFLRPRNMFAILEEC
jgi:hypothetical protein